MRVPTKFDRGAAAARVYQRKLNQTFGTIEAIRYTMVSGTGDGAVTVEAWMKGIGLSVAASIIGGASKLAIRKSWLLEQMEDTASRVGKYDPVAITESSRCGSYGGSSRVVARHDLLPLQQQQQQNQSHFRTDETTMTVAAFHAENDVVDSSDCGLEPQREPQSSCSDEENDNCYSTHSSFTSNPPASRSTRLPLCLRMGGMIGMTFLNPLCCVLAMNYASPSILAPFSGLTLVWIVLFSFPLLGEQPAPRQVVASSLIVLGEVVVALFGDHTNDDDVTLDVLVCSTHMC